ncbi:MULTISPECIES: efflux RND transporter periplasmic adaptor subunit [Ectothiorhodospira]|uniref:RND family efflux transporter, MFP subunit n=1 Tax=Ectothiorhodospira marina TaxID=1396821 RepID=A0A1H7LX83_9GAMM|nr:MULTISPECIES: efflux RND transporter periplasmic adaptor subunit [Ectothiorhodospira]MCG5516080.1 efflux RND transporter periplasmic adaptor subunit [Ectothiorhodospira sp. 9100]MCG5519110.1 efflux RND transporter periplasmic adaptor subunit [Ectothiorhodospira sp. 9905]SEL03492.1 RND family efflux transporter, MFP subunit [Ectothiorhodospira marina]
MKRLPILIPPVLILLAVLVWWGTGSDSITGPGPGNGQGAVAVTVERVSQADLTDRSVFTGSLVAAHRVEIATRVAGRLDHLHVDIGDQVAQGQLLAELDDDAFQQEVEQARAELAVSNASLLEAQAALTSARRALDRTRELRAQRVASQSELESAETDVEARQAGVTLARSQIAQRQAALRNAQIRLDYTRIQAELDPGEGQWLVADRMVDQGSILQANTPILALVNLQPLRARVFVTERDYAHLEPGQQAHLSTVAHPGEQFEGRVIRVAPEFREASRQARVEIQVPNPDQRLRPGMFVEARVSTRSVEAATVVPFDAILERDGQSGVFRVEEGDNGPIARFVAVTPGIEDDGQVEILQPEIDGRVVTLGQHLLSDGVPLRIADDEQVRDAGARR